MSPSFPFQLKIWGDYYECTWTMNKWWVHLFRTKKYEEAIMNVHERWISDESIFPCQLKKYEETIMNVYERWISDESIFSVSTKKYEEAIMNVHERWISDESIFAMST